MRLELMTTGAVAAHIARQPGIVVPVGSTEQHGPDGLIGTDHLCPQAIARQAGARHGFLVAPTLAYGMSQFHLGFAGTIALRPSTLTALTLDIIASLAATGFRRIYLLNGHGGNLAPLRSAAQEFYATRSFAAATQPATVHCIVRSWWELPTVDALRKTLYGRAEGYHATPSEIAVTMAVHPAHIAPFERPAPELPPAGDVLMHAGDNYYDAADYKDRFPDGRVVSDSALARPEHGQRLLDAAVADLAAEFDAFMATA